MILFGLTLVLTLNFMKNVKLNSSLPWHCACCGCVCSAVCVCCIWPVDTRWTAWTCQPLPSSGTLAGSGWNTGNRQTLFRLVRTNSTDSSRVNHTAGARYDLLYYRFGLLPASLRAAVQQHRSICGHVAWWRADWQPEPIRSLLWCGCSTPGECKLPPECQKKEQVHHTWLMKTIISLYCHNVYSPLWLFSLCNKDSHVSVTDLKINSTVLFVWQKRS